MSVPETFDLTGFGDCGMFLPQKSDVKKQNQTHPIFKSRGTCTIETGKCKLAVDLRRLIASPDPRMGDAAIG